MLDDVSTLCRSQGILEGSRKWYIELSYRIAEIPLNSENIVRAHRIMGELSEARNFIRVNMGVSEEEDLYNSLSLDDLLGRNPG